MKFTKNTKQAIWMIAIVIVLALLAGTVEQDNGRWPASSPEHEDFRLR